MDAVRPNQQIAVGYYAVMESRLDAIAALRHRYASMVEMNNRWRHCGNQNFEQLWRE
jgi:hypothetical protein